MMSLALSPLIFNTFCHKMQQGVLGGREFNIQDMFVNAIAPIPIALVVTLGFIMMKSQIQPYLRSDPARPTLGMDFFSGKARSRN